MLAIALIEIASIIKEPEDRQKVLRIVNEEFRLEYANDICAKNDCDGKNCPILGLNRPKS